MIINNRYPKLSLRYKNNAGVNLVELMISLTIMSILASIAAPSFNIWMSNMKIKSNTENIFSGIAQARAEAIKINSSVSFNMDSEGSWNVLDISKDKVIFDNKQSSTMNTISSVTSPSDSTTITFNGLGRVIPNSDLTSTIEAVSIESKSEHSDIYASRVTLNSGGSISTCSYNPNSATPC